MMSHSPLDTVPVFHLGPVPVTGQVLTSSVLIVLLVGLSALLTRRLTNRPERAQMILESIVVGIHDQIRAVIGCDPKPFLPLLGTLFIFVACANLSSIIPGVQAPTAHLETPAALAIAVYFSVHYFGIRSRGLWQYLKSYAHPNILLLPLNVLSEVTRSFSLMVRLFGNMMSHEFVIGIVLALAGLFVPIPFMALAILIGLIQAYIITILAAVFIGGAISAEPK